MIHLRIVALLLTGAVLGATSLALADVPPPPDYVEQCTRAKQELDDEYCELRNAGHDDPYGCLAGAENKPADPQACANAGSPTESDCCAGWTADGWSYRCSTYGATAFSAMWCRARQQGDPERPEDTTGTTTTNPAGDGGGSGCAISTSPSHGNSSLVIWLALGAALLGRRAKQ